MGDSFRKGRPRRPSAAHPRYWLGTQAPRRKLFERAESPALGLAPGAVDGAGFGPAHLGMFENQRRGMAGMSAAVPDETPGTRMICSQSS
jgi:hypothetical protein